MNAQLICETRALLADLAARDEFSGVVHLQKGDDILLEEAYGLAVRPWQAKNTPTTRFRIASISKLFTAVAVLQLVEAGRIALDTRVVPYLGLQGTRIPTDVTVFHLLTHTSGIADYFDEDVDDEEAAWDELWSARALHRMRATPDYLPLFSDKAPLTPPGAVYKYSGAGYILLGLLIAKASGQSDFDYIREHVFVPAGLARTDFIATDDVVAETAVGYEMTRDKQGNVTWRSNVNTVTPQAAADGGATSTAPDLIRFMQALRRGELVAPNLAAAMVTPHALVAKAKDPVDYDWWYGFANFLVVDSAGCVVRTGHTGEEYGVSGRLLYYPNADIDVAILANQGSCAGRPSRRINELILGRV